MSQLDKLNFFSQVLSILCLVLIVLFLVLLFFLPRLKSLLGTRFKFLFFYVERVEFLCSLFYSFVLDFVKVLLWKWFLFVLYCFSVFNAVVFSRIKRGVDVLVRFFFFGPDNERIAARAAEVFEKIKKSIIQKLEENNERAKKDLKKKDEKKKGSDKEKGSKD